MMNYVWVAIGGALGSVVRFWASGYVQRHAAHFPLGTLFVNVTGSLLIGFLAAWVGPAGKLDSSQRIFVVQFLMFGICGGYTTFSAFSLNTLELLQKREWLYASGNIVLSVVLCLHAVLVGYLLGLHCASPKGA